MSCCQLQNVVYCTETVNGYFIAVKEQYLLHVIHINVILTTKYCTLFYQL